MSNIKKMLLIGLPLLLAGLLLAELLLTDRSHLSKEEALGKLLKEAQQREEKAVIVRHVSKQMEEIAYQQKEISDTQRKEAEWQATENFRMKLRVEEEWKKAVTAQQEAVEAYRVADSQKALAQERQYQAEYAKRVADTLTYLTLGRSLGSLSVTQYKTGNYETAALLAYAAWNFINKYRGDVFLSSVFNSLSLSAGESHVWLRHKGGVSAIAFLPVSEAEATFYTVSRYGEVLLWSEDGKGDYLTKSIFHATDFDFRAAHVDSVGVLYALSYDGRLLEYAHGQSRIREVQKEEYTQMMFPDDKRLLSLKKDHPAAATSFSYCSTSRQLAIGYADGMILLYDPEQQTFRRLIGHRSAVTAMVLEESKLYSCGYDRTLRLWNLTVERPESVVVLESTSWFHSLTLGHDEETLFAGDEGGNLYRMCVSPDRMAAAIHKKLTRSFTPAEWRYYMGTQIPYEKFTP